jgi:nucleotide-binding universal stress UspA family protein
MQIERILVGLDGSSGSARALDWAIGLARATEAEILAVHAFEPPYPAIAPPVAGVPVGLGVGELEIERTLRDEVERAFDAEWSAPLEGAGVRHRRLFEEGPAGDVLLDVARRERAGLVVTGRRGRGALVAILTGSVSQHLVHRSPIPVTVVPDARG